MSQKPDTVVSDVAARKPRLLVFDDDVNQLANYCAALSHKYEVEGVLVSFSSEIDALSKECFADNDWVEAMDVLEAYDIQSFDSVKHLVTSKTELRDLLKDRKPDYVLSDYQMRHGDTAISGADVMRIAAEVAPRAPRAVHTGAGFAQHTKVKNLNEDEKVERAQLVTVMKQHNFKLFPKPLFGRDFDPSPIIDHFEARQTGRDI